MEAVVDQLATAIIEQAVDVPAGSEVPPPFLVALVGVPGAGTTTLTNALAAEITRRGAATLARLAGSPTPPSVVVAGCTASGGDGYHMTREALRAMDDPDAAFRLRGAHWTFDGALMVRHLAQLRATGAAALPSFDHAAKDPVFGDVAIDAATTMAMVSTGGRGESAVVLLRHVVIIEGIWMMMKTVAPWDAVSALFDFRVFLRCPLSVTTERLTRRHMRAWGIGEAAARERAAGSDYDNSLLIDATAQFADLVVESADDGAFVVAFDKTLPALE
jgi:pantothenate kinase